ncbi:MAG: hypothetical protein AAFV43_11645 [Planctomycetota bacterium]
MPDRLRSRAKSVFWRAALMLLIGGAAFYTLKTIQSSVGPRPPGAGFDPTQLPIAADTPELAEPRVFDTRGDGYIARAIAALAGVDSFVAQVVQEGRADGRDTRLAGEYAQTGTGDSLRFSLRVQGRLVGQDAQLLRVSDSRFLWTDLVWNPAEARPDDESTDRFIRRVDLRRVRREAEGRGDAVTSLIAARFGGLPMLLATLDREYDFAAPRVMQLEGERVLALVGRTSRRDPADSVAAPHHVVLALEEASLGVRLVEYRGVDDPLSSSAAPDEARLRPSAAPLLRIRYGDVRTGVAIADAAFVYTRPRDLPWRDETQRELRLVRSAAAQSAVPAPVAALPSVTAGAARR